MPARTAPRPPATAKRRVREPADPDRIGGHRPALPPAAATPTIDDITAERGDRVVRAARSRRSGARSAPVRLGMSLAEAREVEEMILDSRGSSFNRALRELLWLQVVLIEQWRRTARPERKQFERRADAILATFWEGAMAGVPSGPGHTVGQHDKP